jgi:hypothetical protein
MRRPSRVRAGSLLLDGRVLMTLDVGRHLKVCASWPASSVDRHAGRVVAVRDARDGLAQR